MSLALGFSPCTPRHRPHLPNHVAIAPAQPKEPRFYEKVRDENAGNPKIGARIAHDIGGKLPSAIVLIARRPDVWEGDGQDKVRYLETFCFFNFQERHNEFRLRTCCQDRRSFGICFEEISSRDAYIERINNNEVLWSRLMNFTKPLWRLDRLMGEN